MALAPRGLPAWRFVDGRSHWFVAGGHDAGLPDGGVWTIPVEQGAPQVIGPVRCWRAESAPVVVIEAAWNGAAAPARLRWQRLEEREFDPGSMAAVNIPNDDAFHRVVIPLAGNPAYQGLITKLRLDPPPAGPNARLRLRAIEVLSAT